MIEQTQRLIKEIEIVSNNNLLLRASLTELERDYEKLRRAYNELLDLQMESRERMGFGNLNDEFQYDWVVKAGLDK